jgi:hypothetical protein
VIVTEIRTESLTFLINVADFYLRHKALPVVAFVETEEHKKQPPSERRLLFVELQE